MHLKVGNTVFTGELLPSKIIPGVELIKNAERSLNGTLHVDITASKRKLQIAFDLLRNQYFEEVLDVFKVEDVANIDAAGLTVEYYDLRDNSDVARKFFVENVSFMPHIVDDGEIMWQDVTVDLIEI